MREKWTLALALLAPLMLVAASCGDDVYTATAPSSDASTLGNEGEPCFSNGTCNAPYKCVQAVCYVVTAADAAPVGDGSSLACPQPVPASEIPSYHPPDLFYGIGSCNAQDVTRLTESLSDANTSPSDWYDEISTSCQKCVFSGQSDATWQIIVIVPDLAEGLAADDIQGFVNAAPCYREGPGGSTACATAAQLEDLCVQNSCPSPQCDSDSACDEDSKTTVCASQRANWQTQCGAAFDSLRAYCDGPDGQAGIIDLISEVCGPGGDAGASDDAGNALDADTSD